MKSVKNLNKIEPQWFNELILKCSPTMLENFYVYDKILRQKSKLPNNQEQTKSTFSFKWRKESSYKESYSNFTTDWLNKKYGKIEDNLKLYTSDSKPLILDAGCGAGVNTLCYFKNVFDKINLVGVDVSDAIDIFRKNLKKKKINDIGLMQADLNQLPFKNNTFDFIFSEGVLHHTESTKTAINKLSKKLKPKGIFMFYVYKKKAPIREFSDDYVRNYLQKYSAKESWNLLKSLTELGVELGKINQKIVIKKPIKYLGIPAGETTVQRLIYWNFLKLFYREDFTFEECLHINFDWFIPTNALRQTPEDIKCWCEKAKINIIKLNIEKSGMTVIGKKN